MHFFPSQIRPLKVSLKIALAVNLQTPFFPSLRESTAPCVHTVVSSRHFHNKISVDSFSVLSSSACIPGALCQMNRVFYPNHTHRILRRRKHLLERSRTEC